MAKKPTPKPSSKPKPKSKLGRGLSALMADIAVPLEPTPAQQTEKKQTEKKQTEKALADSKPVTNKTKNETPSMLSAVNKINQGGTTEPLVSRAEKPKLQKSTKTATQTANLANGAIPSLEIDHVERNPDQPRKVFNKEKLAELTKSIQDNGVLQPILVRPLPERYVQAGEEDKTRYQIVAGERRWLAALMAGLLTIPAMVRDLTDQEVLEVGVIENVQRADLNPIEEAQAYAELISQFGRKQSEIADAIGKSRPYVANALRLLNLPKVAQEYLLDGKITAGHARAILAAPDPQALAEAVVRDGLSVRAAEKLAKTMGLGARDDKKQTQAPDANVVAIEKELSEILGMSVGIDHKIPGGKLTVKYTSMDHLDDLVKRLRKA